MGRKAAGRKASYNPKYVNYLKALATRIVSLRRGTGETMEGLAQACHVTRGTIHKVEHPQENEDITLGTVWAMARHFGMTLEELLNGLDERAERGNLSAVDSAARELSEEDYMAFARVTEETSLQIRADLAEQACLVATDETELELLAQHSARLRQRRYSLLLKKRET